MRINNKEFNVDVDVIITVLKEQLERQGIQRFAKMFDSGDDVMICCPYHKDGQERNPSAGIRKSDGLFHCFACGETHSLAEMIADVLGYKDESLGYKWLIENFATTEVQERGKINVSFSRLNNDNVSDVVHTTIGEDVLDTYRYTHPYLYKRGLTDEIIERFDVGYDKSTDSITFPVRDKNGDCMFVARRQITTKAFNIPKGINKPLYGMYELSRVMPDKVYVCEGPFDCLRLWCNNKYAVAGFGCLFNSYQVKQLQDLPVRTIVLALDNDDAGRKAIMRLRKMIQNKIIKEVVLPTNRKDVGECTDEEICNLKEIL